MLDTKTKEKTAYITGNNNTTYTAFMYEQDDINLTIAPKRNKQISIKFNKRYSPNIQINKITFTDIVPNLKEYSQEKNKKEYKNKTTIEVEL